MKITGYKLQHAIRELTHEIAIAAGMFDNSLILFPGEEKVHPEKIMTNFRTAEDKLAKIQTEQARYNLLVKVKVLDGEMTISQAVKLVGGAGRAEKMWRSAAAGKKDRYHYDTDTRDANTMVAKRVLSVEECVVLAKRAARYASALREAIQVGNATVVELEELTPEMFQ